MRLSEQASGTLGVRRPLRGGGYGGKAAQRCRDAVLKEKRLSGLNSSEFARACDISPSTVHNLVTGGVTRLYPKTVAKMVAAFPNLPADLLMGLAGGTDPKSIRGMRAIPPELQAQLARTADSAAIPATSSLVAPATSPVTPVTPRRLVIEVRMEASVESAKHTVLPPHARSIVGAPLTTEWAKQSPFGVVVRSGAEHIYPQGTILLCTEVVHDRPKQLKRGMRVILSCGPENNHGSGRQVTVREVFVEGNRLWLHLRSGHEEKPELLPKDYRGDFWQWEGRRLRVIGVVKLAMVPEAIV